MALTLVRISALTSAGSTPKMRDPTKRCRSSPAAKASMRPASPERCAMIRISICE